MSNFWQRTLSGAVYVAVVVGSILWHNSILFGPIITLVAALAVREFHHLRGSHRGLTIASVVSTVWLVGATYALLNHLAYSGVLICYLLLVIASLLIELFRHPTEPLENWGAYCASQIMIALPFALMNGVLAESKYLLLILFITIWLNDSGAYCVGSLMAKRKGGNHKMFPRVSPGKSWEGLVGGIVVALGAGLLFAHWGWLDSMTLCATTWVNALILTASIAVFGTLGDLIESLMKRTIGVKDSGRFLPGHGGVLDRFDSLLLATPIVWVLLML